MGREQWKRWLLLLVIAVLTSLLEIAAAALVYVLLSLVAMPEGSISFPVIGDIRRIVGNMEQRTLLLSLAGIIMAFFLVRAVVVMAAEYTISRVINNAGARLSVRLAKGYLEMPYALHLQRNSAEMIRNCHQAVQLVTSSVFDPFIRVTAEVILTLGLLVLLILVSPVGAALAIGVVGAVAVVIIVVVQPRLKRMGQTSHLMQKNTLGSLQQAFLGIRDIKLLGREGFFADSYGESRRLLAQALYLRGTYGQLPRVLLETSLLAFILLFFAVTIASGDAAPKTLSLLGLFGYAGLRLQPSVQRIVTGLNNIKYSTAPVADMFFDLREMETRATKPTTEGRVSFQRDLVLDGVSFRYDGADHDVLTSVSIRVHPGQQVGICGSTGGGKTTLVDIITGLLRPTAGRVLVDGQDICSNVREWQRIVGVVPQTVFLLDDTVRRNIAFGIRDRDVDTQAMREAVSLAQLDDFVAPLTEGLDTVVGERGTRISGGERQRIAIARALYHRPKLLVLDEGTSALDNATEGSLMRCLDRLRGECTVILVAHRLSTVRDADQIIFLEDGAVAGIDTFENLYSYNERFRRMAGE